MLALTLAWLGLAGGTAEAQLLDLSGPRPLSQPQDAVTRLITPVQQLAHSPLPAPLEQIVQDSPVAPVRGGVRDAVGTPGSGLPIVPGGDLLPGDPGSGGPVPGAGSSGGGSPSGGSVDGPSRGGASGGADPSGSASALPNPDAAPANPQGSGAGDGPDGTDTSGSRPSGGRDFKSVDGPARDPGGRGAERRSARGGGGAARSTRADGSGGNTAGSAIAGSAGERPAARAAVPTPGDESESVVQTVTDIVEVVPRAVWAALGLLTLLSLISLGRAVVERRRARALRLERGRLLRDMGLLERVLLPRVPERIGDLAVSVAYRPAAGPAAGGDFYDVFELPGGRVGLFVGDVSGHGREALECTSALRPALRGHLEAGLSPRAALEAAGRAAGIDPAGRFTTAVVAVHDPAAGTLTYAHAGHPPPVLVGPGAHEPVLVASSPPIGVGLPTGMRQTTVPLPCGSAACFVTDGLLEARSGDELLGREWLESVVAGFGPLDSAEALLDRVFEAADLAPDDMTACLVRAVDGSSGAGPRVEELELAPDDVGAPAPGRFLEACGVPAEAVEDLLVDARRLAVQAGKALLTVTIDGDGATVRVTAAIREALATT